MKASRRGLVVGAFVIGTFLSSLDVTVVGTAMPSIAAELQGLSLYGWVFGAYLLASAVTVPLYGRLADLWGRKRTYFVGVAIFLTGSLACGLAPTMPLLVAARALQGLGAGAIIPITLVAVGDLFEPVERARVLGLFSFVWGISSILGPPIGGLLLPLGWPAVFLLNLPVGGAALATLGFVWDDRAETRPAKLDVPGAVLVAAASLAVLFAVRALESGHFVWAAGLAVAGVLLAIGFVRVEARAVAPIVPPSLARDPVIAVSVVNGLALGGVLFVSLAFVPLFLRGVLGYEPAAAGIALVPMSFLWSLGAFMTGRFALSHGYRTPVRAGSLFGLAGSAALVAGVAWRDALTIVLGSSSLGIGMGLGVTAMNVAAQDRTASHLRGAATASIQFSRTMGGTVVVSVLGTVLAWLAGTTEDGGLPPPDELARGLLVVFTASLGISALGVVSAFAFPAGVRPGDRPLEHAMGGGGAQAPDQV